MTPVQTLQAVNEDLKKAMEEISAKYGLQSMTLGKSRYDDNGYSTSIEVVFGGGESKEMAKLRRHAVVYGLKEDVCGAEVLYSNDRFKVMGMRNTKIILEKAGKQYVANIDAVVTSIKHYHKELCL